MTEYKTRLNKLKVAQARRLRYCGAADDFRSVNGQIEWIISQKLKEVGRFKTGTADGISKSAGKGKK